MRRILALFVLLQGYQTSQSAGIAKSENNSGITYVQIKPLINRSLQPNEQESSRSSRIENVPLQIKGVQTHPFSTPKPQDIKNVPLIETVRTPRSDEKVILNESYGAIVDITDTPENFGETSDQNHESEVRFDTSEAILPGVDDTNPKISDNTQDNDLYSKTGPFFIKNAVAAPGQFGKPRFFSLKKYYGGNFDAVEPGYRKYLETRRFRSKCRCERIWNCPKLQVSVPRCPAEYFLCCF